MFWEIVLRTRRYCRSIGKGLVSAAVAVFVTGLISSASAETVLRIAHNSFPSRLGNVHFAYAASEVIPNMAFFDSLTYTDEAGNVVPGLAISWKMAAPDTWVFKLRPDVKFQNGEAFNAAAVVADVDFLVSESGASARVNQQISPKLASARALDGLTVEIKTKAPNPILDRQVAIFRVVAPKYWADVGPDVFARRPIGTGSYKVANWGPDKIEAEAFGGGWRPPKIDKLEIIELPENASRVQGLNSGQIDIALTIGPDDRAAIEASGGSFVTSKTLSVLALMFNNVMEGPLRDARVRRALNYGVDKQAFIDQVLGGLTVPAGQPATRATNGYNPGVKPYPYDPQMAKQLLAEAGYADGLKLSAEIVTTVGEFSDAFQFISNELRKINVELELKIVTIPDLIGRILKRTPWEATSFSLQYEAYPTADAMRALGTHSCSYFAAWYCDVGVQPAIEDANVETDLTKREQAVSEIMRRYHDEAAALYMHERVQFDGLSKRVRNYKLVNRVINFHEIEVSE